MRSPDHKPAIYVHGDSELSLSNSQMIELIKGVLAKGAAFRFRAKGWSMSPFIRDGDILTLTPMERPPSAGDVVAFTNPANGRLVVHRLVRIKKGSYEFKGDNMDGADHQVSHADILGKVVKVERMKKTVRLGLGMEKRPIALLSRANLLVKLNRVAYSAYRLTKKVVPCL